MEDSDYETKLDSLRRYIPFLKNMMIELEAKGNRQAQLTKIKSLHDMITDTRKKLKLETLIRCEQVLTNIYHKVNPQIKSSRPIDSTKECASTSKGPSRCDSSTFNRVSFTSSPSSTPRSPSPVRNIVLNKPVTIPTEKVETSAVRSSLHARSNESRPKVDVYSNVVIQKPSDVLQKLPDMSKPPISLDDLKTLEDDVHHKISSAAFANKTVFELQEYRKQLQLQLKVDELNEALGLDIAVENDFINPTARNAHTPSNRLAYSDDKTRRSRKSKESKSSSHSPKETKPSLCAEKAAACTKLDTSSNRPSINVVLSSLESEKNTAKETDTFGNLLSSIDDKIIKDTKKTKKAERRSSVTHSKEATSASVVSDKGIEKTVAGENKVDSKGKNDKELEITRPSQKNDGIKVISKTATDDKFSRDKTLPLSLNELKCAKGESENCETQGKVFEKNLIVDKEKGASNSDFKHHSSMANKISNHGLVTNTNFEKMTRPTFKRLADKYNPKPKPKPVETDLLDIDKVVSEDIEKSMKTSSVKSIIPAFEQARAPTTDNSTFLIQTPHGGPSSCVDPKDNKPVQLPRILQNIFTPLHKDNCQLPQLSFQSPPRASVHQHNNSGVMKPNTLLSPQQSILSPTHRPILFQPPGSEHSLGQIVSNMVDQSPSAPIRRPSVSYSDCPSSLLSTLGSGVLPQPSFPSTVLPGVFTEHGVNISLSTPRVDFDAPCTPRANFDLPLSEGTCLNTDQYSIDQRFDSSHLNPTYPNMDQYSLNQRFDSSHMEHPQYMNPSQYPLNQRFIPPMTDHNMQGYDTTSNFARQSSFNKQGGFYGSSQVAPVKFEPMNYTSEQNYQQERFRWFRDKRLNDPRSYREYKAIKERQEREAKAVEDRQKDITLQKQNATRDPRLLTRGLNTESNCTDKSEILVKDPRLSAGKEKSADRTLHNKDDSSESNDFTNLDEKRNKNRNRISKDLDGKVITKELPVKSNCCSKEQTKLKTNKFDEMYSNRSASKTRAKSSDRKTLNQGKEESFSSPLESLYSCGENRNTNEVFGFKTFRIPRKSKRDPELETTFIDRDKRSCSRSRRRRVIELSESDESDENMSTATEPIQGTDPIQNKNLEELHSNEDIGSKVNSDVKNAAFIPTENENENALNKLKINLTRIKVVINSDKENVKDIWQSSSTASAASAVDDFVSEYDIEFRSSLLEQKTDASQKADGQITQSSLPMEDKEISISAVEGAAASDSINKSAENVEISNDRSSDNSATSQRTTHQNVPPSEQNILAHFFENLLKSHNKKDKKTALFSLIETFSDSFEDREIQKIRKIINADGNGDDDKKETGVTINKEYPQEIVGSSTDALPEEHKLIENIPVSEVTNTNENKIPFQSQEEDGGDCDQVANVNLDAAFLEPIQMSVGERIKSRKRVVTKPKKKFKSELDFLHEDIQDMFIRDGVLTATGKRMCRMLKDDPNALDTTKVQKSPEIEPVAKPRRKPMPKSKLKELELQEKSMKDMRVVINKIPDDILSSNRSSAQLKRHTRKYVESEDELSDQKSESSQEKDSFLESVEALSEKSDVEVESGNDSEGEITTRFSPKTKTKRRKTPKWAAGVISKNKKKKTQQKLSSPNRTQSPISSYASDVPTDDEELENDRPEHDKNYFADFKTKQKLYCKLCNYKGLMMTIHYLKEHPESEVLSSRFPPDIAEQAIKDFAENGNMLEEITNVKLKTKYEYSCRLCGYASSIAPITFYEHVTVHTGEYRHKCVTCNYVTASSRAIKSHFLGNHKGEETTCIKINYSLAIIFVYMCGECNYFQIEEKCIQSHINKYHLESKPTIYKINMSTVIDERLLRRNSKCIGEHDNSQLMVLQGEQDNSIKVPKPTDPPILKKPVSKLRKRPGPKSKTFGYVENEQCNILSDNENTPLAQLRSNPQASELAKSGEDRSNRDNLVGADNVSNKSKSLTTAPPSDNSLKTSRKRKRSLEKLIAEDSGDNLDSIITLSSRSCRAAKQKATEKLKSLMENSDPPPESSKVPEKNTALNESRKSQENQSKDIVKEKLNLQGKKVESQPVQQIEHRSKSDDFQSNEQDLNVFTCRTDILQEDAKKIEEDRLRKMDELNKSIGSRPLKLEFVNKLSEMLNNEQNEQLAMENVSIDVKVEPNDSYSTNSSITLGSTEYVHNFQSPTVFRSDHMHLVTKKPVLEEQPTVHQADIKFNQNKPNSLFSNMIEKLQGKVNEAAENQQEVLTQTEESIGNTSPVDNGTTSSVVLAMADLIKVTKMDNELIYSCIANNCYVSTKDKLVFQLHCKFGHKNLNLKSSLCSKCGILIEPTPDTTLLENLYDHLVYAHSDFLSMAASLRMRKLSGDKLSIKDEEKLHQPSVENVEKDRESTADYAYENDTTNNSAGNEDSCAGEAVEVAEDNPFSFKIASVMSLAESNDQPTNPSDDTPVTNIVPLNNVPTLSLLGKPPIKQNSAMPLVVKEAKMSTNELKKPKKAPRVMKKFIAAPFDLYKCPHFYCGFSTNVRILITRHVKVHLTQSIVAMVPCVYCDIKTPWEHVPMHIDIRHANSRFSCSLCLYRGILKEYVELHQKAVHHNVPCSIITIPSPRAVKKFSAVAPKNNLRVICKPFRCVCKNKEGLSEVHEFLLERDFVNHIKTLHDNSILECSYNDCLQKISSSEILDHWAHCHGVYSFQCAYCRVSGKDRYILYSHFWMCHSNLMPDILDRTTHPESNEDLRYTDEAFNQIRHIKIDALKKIAANENRLSTPTNSSAAGKEITFHDEIPAGSSMSQPSLSALPNSSPTSNQPSQRLPPTSKLQLVLSSKLGTKDKIYIVPASVVSATSTTTTATTNTTVSAIKASEQPKGPVRIGNITIYPAESALCNPPIRKIQSSQSNISATSMITHSTDASANFKVVPIHKSVRASGLSNEQNTPCGELIPLCTRNSVKKHDLLKSAIDSILTEADQRSYELTTEPMSIEKSKNTLSTLTEPIKPDILLRPSNVGDDLHKIESIASIEHIEIVENSTIETTKELPIASTNSIDPLSENPLTEESPLSKDGRSVNNFNKFSPGAEPAVLLKIGNMHRSASMISNSDDESDYLSAEKKQRGLSGHELFRCSTCNLSFVNVKAFKSHVFSSFKCKQILRCAHCHKLLKSFLRLTDHILTHGLARFSCSLCDDKFTIASIARHHMRSRHSLNQTTLVPLIADQFDPEEDCFVIKPSQATPGTSREKDVTNETPNYTGDNSTYAPDQIDCIPIRQIFSSNVKCGVCNYQTKVRVNIIRHLQMHLDEKAVSDSAPVNPVPCLEKNEKMFDKMINFAASSITTGRMSGTAKDKKDEEKEEIYPDYVPTHRRYVCGAEGCAYLCPEESNLKHHLMALHSDDNNFICAHCKIKIEPNDIEHVMKHFKMHGLHLYKCHYCHFVHHLKHKIEKHSQDSHPDVAAKVDTIRYMESEPQAFTYQDEIATPHSSPTKLKPWCCCMCKSKYNTREDVQAHIIRKHNVDTQYKCTLCAFKSDDEVGCQDHFKDNHPNHTFDIVLMYQKVEEEINEEQNRIRFDTTPLWQRDKHRVRHIRGILFDDSSPQPTKSAKKMKTQNSTKTANASTPKAVSSPSKDLSNSVVKSSASGSLKSCYRISDSTARSNLWDCIDAVARGSDSMVDDNQPSTSGLYHNKNIESLPPQKGLDEPGTENMKIPKMEQPEEDDSDDVIDVTQSPKVIVIDSEDSDHEDGKSMQSDATDISDTPNTTDQENISVSKNRTVKRSGGNILHEPAKVAKIDDTVESDYAMAISCSKENLVRLFGDLGEPHNKQWMCPKCRKFKSKRVGDFMFHIYKDFNLYRYRCNSCKDISITYKYMQEHLKVHPGCKEDIIEPLATNIKLNTWIHMVIQKQSALILKNTPLLKTNSLLTGPMDIKCLFCPKKFMSMPECCEHMLYHWVMMPYQCQHCRNEFFTIYDLKHHHHVEHPDANIYLEPKGATLEKALHCIEKTKKKALPPAEEMDLSNKPELNENPSKTKVTSGVNKRAPKTQKPLKNEPKADGEVAVNPVINLEDEDESSDHSKAESASHTDKVYACETCAFFTEDKAEIMTHLKSIHEICFTKFHILSKLRADSEFVPKMACNICEDIFSELNLRRHFLEVHRDEQLLYAPYRFKCSLCTARFYSKAKMNSHFVTVHGISRVNFQTVGNKKTGITRKARYKEFSCTLCNFVTCSATTVPIRWHLRGHLKPISCNYCSARFQKQGEYSLHCQSAHEGCDESYTVLNDVMNELSEAMRTIITNAIPILPEPSKSAKKKNFARKSTSALLQRCSDDEKCNSTLDLSSISTTFHLNDLEYTTTAQEMMKIVNMDTYVDMSDCTVEVLKIDRIIDDAWPLLKD
ncbi:uncharacterized protein LOC125504304 [Dendroctonus ponderosae]|nr:uncharacterized protein LOC109542141 [Dendroctonus ponderosae]XP_048519241.1 uncharacterized protein LOC109542141 [Dendroctonus ponderosae]XP_048522075.1 uncharacterized protein LOC125504304 [Dendroctonus ponderosae]XP_048522076.1 uncharacterized protein LOC125504304 [Dendroctonus ponderosae]